MSNLVNTIRARIGAFVHVSLLVIGPPAALFGQRTAARALPKPQPAQWADSTSVTPEAQVYRAWQAYFRTKGGDLSANAATASALWIQEEQAKWPMYDLAGFYVSGGLAPNVTRIERISGSQFPAFEITVRFSRPQPVGDPRAVVTATWVVAQRRGRWLLSNALPLRTMHWQRAQVGQIRYFIEPGIAFDQAKARAAVQFIDSLAMAFGVPRLAALDYYVTSTVDAALEALGVEYPEKFGPGGGFAKPVNGQLFAAVPKWGEDYRHELAHLVLRPLLSPSTITIIGSEGIATWVGGSAGLGLRESVERLRQALNARPGLTLDSLLVPGAVSQLEAYAGGAALCQLLFRHGGTVALKAFLRAGPGAAQVRETLTRLLGMNWDQVTTAWRAMVDELAAGRSPPPT